MQRQKLLLFGLLAAACFIAGEEPANEFEFSSCCSALTQGLPLYYGRPCSACHLCCPYYKKSF